MDYSDSIVVSIIYQCINYSIIVDSLKNNKRFLNNNKFFCTILIVYHIKSVNISQLFNSALHALHNPSQTQGPNGLYNVQS